MSLTKILTSQYIHKSSKPTENIFRIYLPRQFAVNLTYNDIKIYVSMLKIPVMELVIMCYDT